MLDARMFDAEEMLAIREQYEERVAQAEARREELEWQVKRALVSVEEAEREARRAIDEMRRVVTGLSAAVSSAMKDEPKRLFDAPAASARPVPAATPRSAKSLDETPVKLTRSAPPPVAASPVAPAPRVISSAPPPEPAPRPVRKTPPPLPAMAARKRPGHWEAEEGTSPDAHSPTLVGSAQRPAIRPAHAVDADTSRDLRPALRTLPAAPAAAASAPPVVSSPVLGYRRLVR